MSIIENDKFTIRNYNKSDIESYIKLFMNDSVKRYLPHLKKLNEEDHHIEFNKLLEDITSNDRNQFRFALIEKSTNNFIGEVGFIITIR